MRLAVQMPRRREPEVEPARPAFDGHERQGRVLVRDALHDRDDPLRPDTSADRANDAPATFDVHQSSRPISATTSSSPATNVSRRAPGRSPGTNAMLPTHIPSSPSS